ncbi:tyrosine recombinase XerS [Sutcliffiella cohnii]
MPSTRQHLAHEEKYKKILTLMPEYVKDYVLFMENNERSPSTLYNYLKDFHHFFTWIKREIVPEVDDIKDIPEKVLEDLPLDAAMAYFNQLSNEKIELSSHEKKKRERNSVNRKKSALRSLFKYLTTQYENNNGDPLFHRNVMLKVPVVKMKESLNARSRKLADSIFHDDKDIDFLQYIKNGYALELSERQAKYFARDRERDFALLSLFLGSGIRVNELAELRIRDLNFEDCNISVIRKGDKRDVVKVFPDIMSDINEYLNIRNERYGGTYAEHEYLFLNKRKNTPSPLTVRAIQDLVRKYTKAFNSGKRSMSPHKLRHTYATNLMDATGDLSLVMEQLGHTSETTALLYVHTSQEKAKKAAEALQARRNRLKE